MMTLAQLTAELAAELVAVEAKAEVAQKLAAEAGAEDARSRVAVDTGATRDSIVVDEDGYGATTPYAGFLENGTVDTAPQPFMGPSADRAEKVFVTALVATIGP